MTDLMYVVQETKDDVSAAMGDEYVAVIFQDTNVFDKIFAKTHKQAHFLAKQTYPQARCNQAF